jgi:flavin reductase (DIM6/NTAB) family NADH-FMN oxidoreductase RutF
LGFEFYEHIFLTRKKKNQSNERLRVDFSKIEWKFPLPIIDGIFGSLECKTVQQLNAGDYRILIGKVIIMKKNNTNPMLYYCRNIDSVPDRWVES